MAASAGDGDRQRSDRGRLVDHDQHSSVAGEFVEYLPRPSLGIDQRRIVQPLTVSVECDRVVTFLADIEPEDHLVIAVHRIASPTTSCLPDRRSGIDTRRPRYEETYPNTHRTPTDHGNDRGVQSLGNGRHRCIGGRLSSAPASRTTRPSTGEAGAAAHARPTTDAYGRRGTRSTAIVGHPPRRRGGEGDPRSQGAGETVVCPA
jgi:hypothetical protein